MSSLSLVRNLQCPLSHWWWWGGSWFTYNNATKLKFGTQVENKIERIFKISRMTHVLLLSSQKFSKSSKSQIMIGRFLIQFFIMLETHNLAYMVGGTCDHEILSQWAQGPRFGLKTHQSPLQESFFKITKLYYLFGIWHKFWR